VKKTEEDFLGPSPATAFRQKAERRLRSKKAASVAGMAEIDVRALVHELQVRQIELEMQNEELHRSEAAAQEASARYCDLFDFAPLAYFLWNDRGRILEVNLAGAALLGLDRGLVVGKRFGQFVALEHRAAFADFCHRVLLADAKQSCEVKLLGDGPVINALIEGVAAPDHQGPRRVCRAAVVDISQRKRAEELAATNRALQAEIAARQRAEEALRRSYEELERRVAGRTCELTDMVGQLREEMACRAQAENDFRRSEEVYRLIAEKVDDVIWIASLPMRDVAAPDLDVPEAPAGLDPVLTTFELSYVSPAIERLTGYTVEEARRIPIHRWLTTAANDLFSHVIARRRVEGFDDSATHEVEIVTKSGQTRWCEVTANTVRSAGGELIAVVGIARDISERRRLQKEISQISSSEQQRLGQELHDGVAQELLGMGLIAKSLHKSLADRKAPEAEKVGELVDLLKQSQHHVRGLMKILRPVEVDAEGLMTALADLADATASFNGTSVTFECATPVPVWDDHTATQLYYIAQEAVRNAVNHSQAGRITIGLSGEGPFCLRIRDNGLGIDLDRQRPAGWGLPIMHHRAGLIGATLEIRCAEEGGTVVTCTFKGGGNSGGDRMCSGDRTPQVQSPDRRRSSHRPPRTPRPVGGRGRR
jgi:PAS domain S-box-containing protein